MKKKYIYALLAAAFLAVVAVLFFFPDDIEGNVLQQHDIMQGLANGQEGKAFHEATGETTRWTNSLFGGMPNFQIAPSYPANAMLGWLQNLFMLWLPQPAGLLFLMMWGFFAMCLCMKMKWPEALFASVAWGFSTYFIILIGAGHIWKFTTLAYIPPTIGGIILLYRRKYLPGTAMTALFGAMQLQSNHPQMTYYFLYVVLAISLAFLWRMAKEKRGVAWSAATVLMLCSGLLAVGANSASLYNSYEYSKETVRGRATDLTPADGDRTGGMDRSAITAWSYGIDETFTLLLPNVKGGSTIQPVAGESQLKSLAETDKADELQLSPEERQFLGQFPQYFGDQPMTNGPVYVGAFVLVLAILALFMVKGPLKWALFAVSLLAIFLSWGHNFAPLTDFFIDHVPAYNKFRAPSSFLVVVEFCVPLLAAMCLTRMTEDPEEFRRNKWTLAAVAGLGALICLVGWISPSVFGEPFSANELEGLTAAGAFTNPAYYGVIDGIRQTRLSLVSGDALRSLLYILIGSALVYLYLKGALKDKTLFVCCVTALVLIDLFSVNKRYVNSDNFTRPAPMETAMQMTDTDREILKDTGNYRVLDIPGMGQARSSYFHKTIGGYHAAKLTRYNDLLERQIYRNNMGVINMLNAKYIITQDSLIRNPEALGNAWFVERIGYAEGADAEMAALDTLDTRRAAVADRSFASMLGNASAPTPGDTIYETSYAPNRLTYKTRSARGGVAVFSEVYFPWGWHAEIDGKPAEIGRANYVLRAMRIPAGEHNVTMTFAPESVDFTNALAVTAVVLIYIACAGTIALFVVRIARARRNRKES